MEVLGLMSTTLRVVGRGSDAVALAHRRKKLIESKLGPDHALMADALVDIARYARLREMIVTVQCPGRCFSRVSS